MRKQLDGGVNHGIQEKGTVKIAIIGGIIVMIILIAETTLMARADKKDTEEAVRKVSLLYLDELGGRREQVMHANLQSNIEVIQVAMGLMTEDDLRDLEHLQAYQARMKKLFKN